MNKSTMYQQAHALFDEHGPLQEDQLPGLRKLPRNFVTDGIYARHNGRRLDRGSDELDGNLMQIIFERMADRASPMAGLFDTTQAKETIPFRRLIRPGDGRLEEPFRDYLSALQQRVVEGELRRGMVLAKLFRSIARSQSDWALRAAIDELNVDRSELTALFFGPESNEVTRGPVDEYPFEADQDVVDARYHEQGRPGYLRTVTRVNGQFNRPSDTRFYRSFLTAVPWTDRQRAWIIANVCLKRNHTMGNTTFSGGVDREFFTALGQLHDGSTFRPDENLPKEVARMDATKKGLDLMEDKLNESSVPDRARGGLGSNHDALRQLLRERNHERVKQWLKRGTPRIWDYYHAAEVSLDDAQPLRMIEPHVDPSQKQHNRALRYWVKGLSRSNIERLDAPDDALAWLQEHDASFETDEDLPAADYFLITAASSDTPHVGTYRKGLSFLMDAGAKPPTQAARQAYHDPPRMVADGDVRPFEPLIERGIYPDLDRLDELSPKYDSYVRNLIEKLPKRKRQSARQILQ